MEYQFKKSFKRRKLCEIYFYVHSDGLKSVFACAELQYLTKLYWKWFKKIFLNEINENLQKYCKSKEKNIKMDLPHWIARPNEKGLCYEHYHYANVDISSRNWIKKYYFYNVRKEE